MQVGKILVAQHQGGYVIKLVGDVRLTLCTTIDDYFNKMFEAPGFVGVMVDLSEAEGIDSTSLGLLAKLAVQAQKNFQLVPLIFSPNPDITRLLESMGFNSIFDIRVSLDGAGEGNDTADDGIEQLIELPVACTDERCVREKVIEAHRVLMDLNDKNQAQFSDLVKMLETCD